jgi:diacylglycerol kinase family enzyme
MRWIVLGRDASLLEAVRAQLPQGLDATIRTGSPTSLAEATRSALAAGEQRILVVGGDRELHDVVDGIRLAEDARRALHPLPVRWPDDPSIDPSEAIRVVVALRAAEEGGLASTLGLGADPFTRLDALATDAVWGPLDVGVVDLVRPDETRLRSVLVSGMHTGLHLLRGRSARRAGIAATELSVTGRPSKGRGAAEPMRIEGGSLGFLSVANGQCDGVARIAPRAVPQDRAFDVLVGRGTSREVRRWRRLARRGMHVPDRSIGEWLASTVSLRLAGPIPVMLDGYRIEGVTRVDLELHRLGIALKV